MSVAPVILFVYNRPEHARRTVQALQINSGARDTLLYVYSDGPKGTNDIATVSDVRSYLKRIDGFKSVTIVERERNMGLAASVIAGVTEVLDGHGVGIVMEDDLLSAPNFLPFMNLALSTYRVRNDIFSVTGYNYPLKIPVNYPEEVYLSYRSSSWGWGTWLERWKQVDWAVSDFAQFMRDRIAQKRFERGGLDLFPMLIKQMDGQLDSWAIRFAYAHAKHDALCLHPIRSRIRNIGFDGTGTHCGVSTTYDVELDSGQKAVKLRPDLKIDPEILKSFDRRFRRVGVRRRIRSLLSSSMTAATRGVLSLMRRQ